MNLKVHLKRENTHNEDVRNAFLSLSNEEFVVKVDFSFWMCVIKLLKK